MGAKEAFTSLFLAGVLITPSAIAVPKTELEQIIDQNDLVPIKNIAPSSYWVAEEKGARCSGYYKRRNKTYNGREKMDIITRTGKVIDTVCKLYFDEGLLMEGSGILIIDKKEVTVNINSTRAEINKGKYYFRKIDGPCKYGVGGSGRCVIPFRTVAADTHSDSEEHFHYGDIIYSSEIANRNIKLPDGSIDDGIKIVGDTGGVFCGTGIVKRTNEHTKKYEEVHRVDFAVGPNKNKNFWTGRKIDDTRSFKTYKLTGESKSRAEDMLKKNYGILFTHNIDSTRMHCNPLTDHD